MIRGRATPHDTARFARESGARRGGYRMFGGLTLSSVGVGTYLGEPDDATDRAVTAAVIKSVGGGINVIDTAINYRSQRAERAVGKAVDSMLRDGMISRGDVFLSTKHGYVTADGSIQMGFWEYVREQYVDAGVISDGDISSGYHCMSVSYLEDQLNRSLSNMGVDCIDLVYLHNALEGQPDMDRAEFMTRLLEIMEWYESKRKQGTIGWYGLATWDCFRVAPGDDKHLSLQDVLEMARRAGGDGHGLGFVQIPYNMYLDEALRKPTQEVGGRTVPFLEAAGMLGVGVFTSVPFMQGRLLSPGVLPEFDDEPSSVRALQFVRSTPGVLAALAGHKHPDHVAENIRIMQKDPLDKSEFGALLKRLLSGA